MDIAVVGAGRVATALAVRLREARHRIVAVSGRDATPARARRYLPAVPVLAADEAARRGEVVLVGTPDHAIAETATALVDAGAVTTGMTLAHLSGATSVAALDAAADVGAATASIHPLQTFPDVDAALARLSGCPFAVTSRTEAGRSIGGQLARDAGGRPFPLDDEAKPLYHAAAVFASNYLVGVTALAERAGRAAGLSDPVALLAQLQRTTLENVHAMGPAPALTGPALRGDAGTIAAHLSALAGADPDAVPAYVALARTAMDLAEASGRLGADGRAGVEEVLGRWT
jgi:predicted short-subunit dehydrogenase-like oxidoreductase (DUF2520 family)